MLSKSNAGLHRSSSTFLAIKDYVRKYQRATNILRKYLIASFLEYFKSGKNIIWVFTRAYLAAMKCTWCSTDVREILLCGIWHWKYKFLRLSQTKWEQSDPTREHHLCFTNVNQLTGKWNSTVRNGLIRSHKTMQSTKYFLILALYLRTMSIKTVFFRVDLRNDQMEKLLWTGVASFIESNKCGHCKFSDSRPN